MIALVPTLLQTTDLDLEAAGHLSSGTSFLLGVVMLFFGCGAGLVALLFHARALVLRGARETDAVEHPPTLAMGPSKIVRGRVELADGTRAPVRVAVSQTVKNHTSKNSTWHTWEELDRSVEAHPFYLTLESGESVLVEPSDQVFVADTIETEAHPTTRTRRSRVCEVSEGELFSAFGTLTQGPHPRARGVYRDGTQGWILRPPRTGRMVLASGTIAERYKGRVSFLRTWAVLLLCGWAVWNYFATVPFMVAAALGQHELATVVDGREWVTRSKNSTTHHYAVTVTSESGHHFEREVTSRAFYTLETHRKGEGARVPVLHAGTWESASYLGDSPTMNGTAVILALVAALVVAGLLRSGYKTSFAWYDKEKLSEPGGKGHVV